jgi:hypothetical protein
MGCQTAKPTKQHQPGVAHEDLQLILQRVPAKVWDALRGRRVFITGGTGFVGCWLLEALIWANQELELELQLIVLSRSPDAFRARVPHLAEHAIVRLVEGNTNALGHISEPFDMLIHAATDVAAANGKPHAVFNDILDGTRQTLELAVRCGASHYLLTSSGAVYGAHMARGKLPRNGCWAGMRVNIAYMQASRVVLRCSARICPWMVILPPATLSLTACVAIPSSCEATAAPYALTCMRQTWWFGY